MEKNPYIELAECLLPEEMVEYFEVVKVEKPTETLDVTLKERDNGVEGYDTGQLRPNGFYEESVVRDYRVSRKSVGIRIQVSDTEKEELLVSNTSEISPE